jgi:phage-related protein
VPRTRVVFYREEGGSVPVLEWFATLPAKAQAKCLERIQFLAAVGHEARRPHADYLRDGIYELRAKWGTVNYRILYFFHETVAAVLAHGLVKEDRVPPKEIDWARERMKRFKANPRLHTHEETR